MKRIAATLIVCILIVAGFLPSSAPVSAQTGRGDGSLLDDLKTAIQTALETADSGVELLDLSLDGKELIINLAGISPTDDAKLSKILSRINFQVNALLLTHPINAQRSIDYYILIDGQPLAPSVPKIAALQAASGLRSKKIVLSAGHGWYDTGSDWMLQRGFFWGIVEDFINADLVIELNSMFAGSGADIRPTRAVDKAAGDHPSGHPWWEMDASEYVRSLGAPDSVWNAGYDGVNRDIVSRPEYANWINADLMISIHNNGGGGACGTETFYDTSNGYVDQSQRFADLVQGMLIERIRSKWNSGWCDRGVKGSNGGYGENRRFNGPAVIIELGYIDNPSDNAALQNAAFRSIAMQAVRDAVQEYFRSPFRQDDFNQDGVPDLFAINKQGLGTNSTEINILDGAGGYQAWLYRTGTPLQRTSWGGLWAFDLADFNRDGYPDLYAIHREGGGSHSTEIHVLNGADGFQTWLLHTGTPLAETGQAGRWAFNLADYNSDGVTDVYVIDREGAGTNSTEIHVLNGADGFQTWLFHTGTPLQRTGLNGEWVFALADENQDGKPDLYAIDKEGSNTNSTEIHVLSGADGYQTWLSQVGTPLARTGQAAQWDFGLVDYNGDGKPDLYAIDKEGVQTNSTEVNILNGADGYQSWLLRTGTPLRRTGVICEWDFTTGGDCIKAALLLPYSTFLPTLQQ